MRSSGTFQFPLKKQHFFNGPEEKNSFLGGQKHKNNQSRRINGNHGTALEDHGA